VTYEGATEWLLSALGWLLPLGWRSFGLEIKRSVTKNCIELGFYKGN